MEGSASDQSFDEESSDEFAEEDEEEEDLEDEEVEDDGGGGLIATALAAFQGAAVGEHEVAIDTTGMLDLSGRSMLSLPPTFFLNTRHLISVNREFPLSLFPPFFLFPTQKNSRQKQTRGVTGTVLNADSTEVAFPR